MASIYFLAVVQSEWVLSTKSEPLLCQAETGMSPRMTAIFYILLSAVRFNGDAYVR